MIKLSCGILAVVMTLLLVAKASEPVGLEVRSRSTIGAFGLVHTQLSVKEQPDGSVLATFNAPMAGSYVLIFTNGPETGKVAMTVRVAKAGPVTAKLRPRKR